MYCKKCIVSKKCTVSKDKTLFIIKSIVNQSKLYFNDYKSAFL